MIEKSELLVDYFLKRAGARGARLDRRGARAAQRVAEVLKLVGDPFQFDLLARKAADLLSIRRGCAAQRGARTVPLRAALAVRARYAREPSPPPAASAAGGGDAGDKAELGLVALALLHPELRDEIALSRC